MGDRGAAGQPQRRAQLGGDDHRERGLAEAGRPGEQHVVGRAAAGLGGVEDQPELLAHALLADHLVEGARSQRRLDRPLVGVGVGGGQPGQVGLLGCLEVVHAQAFRSIWSAARSSAPTSGVGPSAWSATSSTARSASLADQPSPTRPWCTWSRHGAPETATPVRVAALAPPDRGAEPVAQLEDDPLGALLADAGHLGQRLDVLLRDRGPQVVGGEDGEHRLGQLGADPAGGLEQLEAGLLVVVEEAEQGQRVLADHHAGRQRGLVAGAQRGQGAGGAHQLEADSPDLEDGTGEGDTGDGAADERDHRLSCLLDGTGERGVDAGLGPAAPDVGDGQGERVGGVGRLRRLGEPEQPGHHRGDLGLVGAAAAGDGGLDLARGVQGDRQAAARGDQQRDAAGLGGAHDGAEVVLGEDPLDRDRVGRVPVDPVLDAALDGDQALRQRQLGGGAHHAHADQAQRSPDRALDHADTAAGQAGVDPEHAHGLPSSSPDGPSVRTPVRTKR